MSYRGGAYRGVSTKGARALAAALGAGLLAVSVTAVAPAAHAAKKQLVVWADESAVPALQKQFAAGWESIPVVVIGKAPGSVLTDLEAATDESAPDVIQVQHEYVGSLAARSAIVPVAVDAKVTAKFPAAVWSAFAPGPQAFGMPVSVQNAALVSNATLVAKQPATFDELVATATDLVKQGKAKVPFAVGQAPDGNAEATYPLFSGLGGYILGKDGTGAPNTLDLGFANKAFLANATRIDAWNAAKFVRSSMSSDRARTLFAAGKAPFWIASESDIAAIMALGFPYRITAVPTIVSGLDTSPLLHVSGFAETSWAAKHGVSDQATSLVATGLVGKKLQSAIASAAHVAPATIAAQAAMPTADESARLRAFVTSGAKGVPAPSVPQQAQLLEDLGIAWMSSTSGAGATPAKKAFRQAQALGLQVLAG